LKIGIISDSHKKIGRAKKGIDFLIDKGVDYIIHAGDIVQVEVLQYLKASGIVYLAVYGNNDKHLINVHEEFNLVQEPYYFKIQDITFKLMHHPYFMSPDVDVVIYGHTHISHSQYSGSTLFINPGEISARDRPTSTVAILEIDEREYVLSMYDRKLKSKHWTKRENRYQRDV
jgi:putative phosphoesterase